MNDVEAPRPVARLEYKTEPHPNPLVQALIERVEALLEENESLREKLNGLNPR
jgi:hypothetical protein